MVGIYKITNPEGKSYIGLSKNIEKRFQSHKSLQFKGNNKLKKSLNDYGKDSHLFEIIEEVDISTLDRSQANNLLQKRERYWINIYKTFNNGLNENRGGSGCGSHTLESKLKISNALKGKSKPTDFGEKRSKSFYTQEWKDKISKSNKGRKSPMESKISPNKGKIMSDEQKSKISLSNKNKSKPNAGGNKIVQQYDLHHNLLAEYSSISEAHRLTQTPLSGISECCRGNRKTSNKFIWKFKN